MKQSLLSKIPLIAAAGFLLAVASVDWITAPQIGLSIFYLIPIVLVTKRSRWGGLATAICCGCVWLAIELRTNTAYSHTFVPYWNAIVRTSFFCLISILMAEVIQRKRVENSLWQSQLLLEQRATRLAASEVELQRQTDILQSILKSMGDGVVVADPDGGLVLMNPAARRVLQVRDENGEVRIPAAAPRETEAALEPERGSEEGRVEDGTSKQPPDQVASVFPESNLLARAMRGETMDCAELLLHDPKLRQDLWISVKASPLRDSAGKTTGSVVVLTNVTARKDLERKIAEISEREQRRIGEDLHDGLCQELVSTAFLARKLAGRLSNLNLPESKEAAHLADLMGETISKARDIARGLYLVQLEPDGLSSALEELAIRTSQQPDLNCRFIERNSVGILDGTVATSLFRIAQEAVTNALKHAHAGEITIELGSDAHRVQLRIGDNGAGFDPDSKFGNGIGLQMMNYRARMIRADLRIESNHNVGTVVTCSVPTSDDKLEGTA